MARRTDQQNVLARGVCKNGHAIRNEDDCYIYTGKDGSRKISCRTCQKERDKMRRDGTWTGVRRKSSEHRAARRNATKVKGRRRYAPDASDPAVILFRQELARRKAS